MTGLELELDFAKQIIGWKNATHVKGSKRTHRHIKSFKYVGAERPNTFYPTDIRQVIKYAKTYCNRVGKRIDMNCIYRDNACMAIIHACLDMHKTRIKL